MRPGALHTFAPPAAPNAPSPPRCPGSSPAPLASPTPPHPCTHVRRPPPVAHCPLHTAAVPTRSPPKRTWPSPPRAAHLSVSCRSPRIAAPSLPRLRASSSCAASRPRAECRSSLREAALARSCSSAAVCGAWGGDRGGLGDRTVSGFDWLVVSSNGGLTIGETVNQCPLLAVQGARLEAVQAPRVAGGGGGHPPALPPAPSATAAPRAHPGPP